jgi:hypothetical protein
MSRKTIALLVGLNILSYASLWLFHLCEKANDESICWILLIALIPTSICWLISLIICIYQNIAYVRRVRAGSKETIFSQLLAWFIILPFGWILMNTAAIFWK